MTKQTEAQRLAEVFETFALDHIPEGWPAVQQHWLNSAAAELRRLDAAVQALTARAEAAEKDAALVRQQVIEELVGVDVEPVEYQSKTKPGFMSNMPYDWQPCSEEQFAEYQSEGIEVRKLYTAEARAAVRLQEREACASIVENAHTPDCGGWTAQGIADAIRNQGDKQ